MEIRSDFHVHTTFCDGRDTPAQMAETAYALGFHTLGFSGHSMDASGLEICMNAEKAAAYRQEIRRLQKVYQGKLRILCGLELDYSSTDSAEDYDYIIGSVHNLQIGDAVCVIDHTAEQLLQVVQQHFGGDFDRLAFAYYERVSDVLRKTKGDIVGHLDLITKFHEQLRIAPSQKYFRLALDAIHALLPYDKPFEVNVGAITRGYRTTPYPARPLLQEIQRCGGRILFTGDCHDRRYLGKCFAGAVALAKDCGFTEYVDWGEHGFETFPLL